MLTSYFNRNEVFVFVIVPGSEFNPSIPLFIVIIGVIIDHTSRFFRLILKWKIIRKEIMNNV
jgi:hypothetical protein